MKDLKRATEKYRLDLNRLLERSLDNVEIINRYDLHGDGVFCLQEFYVMMLTNHQPDVYYLTYPSKSHLYKRFETLSEPLMHNLHIYTYVYIYLLHRASSDHSYTN